MDPMTLDSSSAPPPLTLAHGVSFADLHDRDGIARIDMLFLAALGDSDPGLRDRLLAARATPDDVGRKAQSQLLVDVAPHLDDFLATLFGIEAQVRELAAGHSHMAPIHHCKRQLVQRRAARKYKPDEAEGFDGDGLRAELERRFGEPLNEDSFARHTAGFEAAGDVEALALAERYAAWAVLSAAGAERHGAGVLFRVPHKLDPYHLVPLSQDQAHGVRRYSLPVRLLRRREGFGLTDPGMDLGRALDQANYCIWCHNQERDACSTGNRKRKSNEFNESEFGVTLAGCPLEEKISEMNLVKSQGHSLGALAIVTIDNPLCAATGHRICNDCMKACIYQKQEPVDIPQVESRTLKDVLALPWGFEIYSLLTRWAPLDIHRPIPAPDSGYKVLVVGLGPAGFNLAHHLMNDGHTVVAIDGLKIEPLEAGLSGVQVDGSRVVFEPVYDIESLRESLDDRVMAGFGGVAEYGITVRWDKNFLKLVRLLLERRSQFAMFGGVRFGGTLSIEDALGMGFDHVALCAGAGKPTFIDMPNALAKGVRMASDFLMALQLTGAAKRDSLANLQVRLPVVVIGGGLTAIDTATESLAYYPRQVQKFLDRYEILVAERGESTVRAGWRPDEAVIADEFIAHARVIRAERESAAREGRDPAIRELLDSWGGVTVAYRRRLIDSPSYTLNHEEVNLALQEGIRFAELLTPLAVEVDRHGFAESLRVMKMHVGEDGRLVETGQPAVLPARTVLVAAGTQPNTVLAREEGAALPALDGKYFQAFDADGRPVRPERTPKPGQSDVLMQVFADGREMSFFGDLHPSFAGNVVKAMGGARLGYPVISRRLAARAATGVAAAALVARLNDELRATVERVVRLTPTIVEVVIRAPRAARNFKPGQFYRLQNYETRAPRVDGTCLAMEGLALTGAWVDEERGLLSTIVLEMGGSSDICALLAPGEPVVLMGPTGAPTEIPRDETVLLAGGGLGNAVLFSIGQALRAAGNRVLYFAGYKLDTDRYHVEDIERAADQVVWCCDEEPGFMPSRPHDHATVANIVEAMVAYARGEFGAGSVDFGDVDRIIAIGSDGMMAAVGRARHTLLKPFLKSTHVGLGSINSPMQCMMKEICAQCLQLHRDPLTGKESVVFSCFNQDQELDRVDFNVLRSRLAQNAVHEKLTAQWVRRCLQRLPDERRGV